MREKDDLDLLIDSALATYADPGPDSGLEDRVLVTLAAVRTETPRERARLAHALASLGRRHPDCGRSAVSLALAKKGQTPAGFGAARSPFGSPQSNRSAR